MTDLPRPGAAPCIRVANKALILRDGALLLNVNQPPGGEEFLCLPGGGQEWGENAVDALIRECREEIGCDVVPGRPACMRDYIAAHHEFAATEAWFHQQETFWWCELAPGAEPTPTETGDVWQTGLRWVPLPALADAVVHPRAIVDWLLAPPDQRAFYLGDVN